MLRAVHGRKVSVDLLANDMWAMGVVLVCLLAGYNIFGINHEDSADLVSKFGDMQTQVDVVIAKQAQWVRLLSWVRSSMKHCKVAVAMTLQVEHLLNAHSLPCYLLIMMCGASADKIWQKSSLSQFCH